LIEGLKEIGFSGLADRKIRRREGQGGENIWKKCKEILQGK
jgi:hypothetical protein